MSEFRTDPLFGNLVLVAHERASRPRRSMVRDVVDASGPCPLCPGNEALCPPEIDRVEAGGRWEARVFPNRYPAVSLEAEVPAIEPGSDETNLLSSAPGFGVHEVIVESPNHVLPFWALDLEQSVPLLGLIQSRVRDLYRDQRIVYAQIFKNHKPASGGSLEHPHFQLLGLPLVPRPLKHLMSADHCRVCALLEREWKSFEGKRGEQSPRFLAETNHFVALADYAPTYAYQFSIYPKAHSAAFEEAPRSEMEDLSQLMTLVLGKFERLLGELALNLLFYTRPNPGEATGAKSARGEAAHARMHWFIRVCPRRSRKAGLELATDIGLVHVAPEDVAHSFREKGL